MPLGHINLIFNYGAAYMHIEEGKEVVVPNAAIIGQITEAKHVVYGTQLDQIGIALKPAGFLAVFHIAGEAINERILKVGDVDAALYEVYIRSRQVVDYEERLQQLYNCVKTNIIFDEKYKRLRDMTTYIECNCETLHIDSMAKSFGISVSTLERFFKKQVGLTPKAYGTIFKFRKNVEDELRRKQIQNYYYDQSHLIKTTKKLSGKTFHELEQVEKELTLQHILNNSADFLQYKYPLD
ncbi:MAG: hypothetical protein PWP24_1793, partial [Clostridiales bacterium]|nr:hypothetical protein [Clostridiales bacterium]